MQQSCKAAAGSCLRTGQQQMFTLTARMLCVASHVLQICADNLILLPCRFTQAFGIPQRVLIFQTSSYYEEMHME